jgi:hypothetical protein
MLDHKEARDEAVVFGRMFQQYVIRPSSCLRHSSLMTYVSPTISSSHFMSRMF